MGKGRTEREEPGGRGNGMRLGKENLKGRGRPELVKGPDEGSRHGLLRGWKECELRADLRREHTRW